MNLEPLIFSPPSSPSPSLWPSPFLPSLLSPILWPILPFLHYVRLSFLKLWANETLSLCLLPQTWLQQKMKLTLEFRLPLNSRLIYPTTHSTCLHRCPMGPSKMSGHKANDWSLTLLPHLLPHSFLHFWNPWFHFPIFHTNNLQGLFYYFLLICLQSVKYFLYYTFKNAQSHLLSLWSNLPLSLPCYTEMLSSPDCLFFLSVLCGVFSRSKSDVTSASDARGALYSALSEPFHPHKEAKSCRNKQGSLAWPWPSQTSPAPHCTDSLAFQSIEYTKYVHLGSLRCLSLLWDSLSASAQMAHYGSSFPSLFRKAPY